MSTDKFGKPEIPAAESRLDHNPDSALVNAKRRRLAKLGVGAPVMMTLASRPVFGGQCLSNMMSGNLSDPNRGNCTKGWSPGGWGQPGGMVHTYSTIAAWTKAGFSYGVLKSGCTNTLDVNCYKNGSNFGNVAAGLAVLNKNSVSSSFAWRKILVEPQSGQLTRHLICAYLNAALSEADTSFNYILTKAQVIGLANGTLPLPPGYTDLQTFLGSTWN